ncbi:helix-turn-helix domain-containing protein [Flavobacterium zepuense]|uniref:histidine kinase n=1 Tax=Flavobacterium zepuense TaxID=2593302 RepID=A0A552V866_9FLAO|nr:hybrid sensor histidine kinase/response regulator transcription factor [Flavobacterium zepuense]TRW26661.1 helix-turn-helix domain-containing protein [Flavobacterium zepuense]
MALAQNVRHLSGKDGLPQSFVSGLEQDSCGFVWISTRNGLARYDGNRFTVFQHKPNNSSSLASNVITDIKKGYGDDLWIKYESGEFDVFNVKTGNVRHALTHDILTKNAINITIRGWCVLPDGTLWYISKAGVLHSYKPSGKAGFTKNDYPFTADTLRSLVTNSKQQLWVLSQKSISRFNSITKKFTRFKIPFAMDFNDELDFGDDLPAIHERQNGELMWTDRQSIFFFNPANGAFRKTPLPYALNYSIKWINTGPDGKDYFTANNIIYSYSDATGLAARSRTGVKNFEQTQAFLVDRYGLIWVGANTDGIYQVDLTANFTAFTYQKDFAADLFASEFGVDANSFFKWDVAGKKGYLPPAYYLRSTTKNNRLCIALMRTVCYYDNATKKLVKLPPLPQSSESFAPIRGITITKQGDPLVADLQGNLFLYDASAKAWQPYFSLQAAFKQNIQPQDIYADDTTVWVTTEANGLIYINIKTKKAQRIMRSCKKFSLPTNNLLGIEQDVANSNLLWIASQQGLLRLDKTMMQCTTFSVEQGLPDNIIYSILPDKAGYLWLGTNKGLCRFDTKTHKQRTFTISYGLPGNEFNRFHSMALPNGKMAFGGMDGWIEFAPLSVKDDNFNLPVAITGIKINNANADTIATPLSLNSITGLNLPYNENSLTIEYAGLQYNQPQDIMYRYRLVGYDNKWVLAGTNREAVYTKIPPGRYKLRINASSMGKWSSMVKTIQINISPPWYNTWWARLLYLTTAVIALVAFSNYRIRQAVLKREMALKEKETLQLRELDAMKTRFFSNITHELRTPLTLILGPAEQLKHERDNGNHNRLLAVIIKNANSLLNLTNQLLDMAKLEAGAMKPQPVNANLTLAIKSIVETFSEDAALKKIAINVIAPDTANYTFAPDMLERILGNLISNALKFSPEGSAINITVTKLAAGVQLMVQDTGIGIPQDKLPYIFDRFYSEKNSAQNITGTGIGLSLVKELVELQGGSVTAQNNTEAGTGMVFTVFLPFKESGVSFEPSLPDMEVMASENNDPEKPLVLVVEDNKELADFIIDNLAPHYRIAYAPNGHRGLALGLELIPDLVVSDVLMEGMDGFEMCRELKSDINTSHIPVLLLTAKADMESRLDGLSYGADDYITKPFNVPELLLRINNSLEQQRRYRDFIHSQINILPMQGVLETENVDPDPFLNKIYEALNSNLDNDAFGVEELVAALHMSRTSLHRKVKALTGISTGELIKAYRLKKAVALLQHNLNISEVAYKTGFGSPAYFTRCFRELYGITPSDFIKKNDV